MKKIITVLVLLCAFAGMLCMTACTSNNTVTSDVAWTNHERLTYSVYDGDIAVGTMKMNLDFDCLTDAEKKLSYGEDSRTYGDASTRVKEELVTDKVSVTTEILADNFTVLALNKRYIDLNDGTKSYTLQSYHDGKNYCYRIQFDGREAEEDRIKVGSSGYTDNEFLYYYIRCYDIGSVPSSVNVANPLTGECVNLACKASAAVTVPTDWEKLTTAQCNKVTVSRTEEPIGSGIEVYYLPDEKGYEYGDYLLKSKKIAVKIVENNVKYVLSNVQASYNPLA